MTEIGKRLAQPPAPEIRERIYRPQLEQVDEDDFAAMLALNQAHLVMLAELKLIDAGYARKLAQSLERIGRAGLVREEDSSLEDAYFAFESRLAQVAGPAAAGALHLARSRNDIGATLDRMRARTYGLRIAEALNEVRTRCLAQAARYADTLMPGYTHLQPAQPVSYGFYLSGYDTALGRDGERLANALVRIDECALGAAALAGSGFAIDRQRTADLLGFSRPTRHGLDTVASRDAVLELLSAVNLLGINWSRMAQDFHVFSSHEFGLLSFPDRVCGISSIMPQKKNPITLEFLKAQSARITGALMGCTAAVRGTHFSVTLEAVREGLSDCWNMLRQIPDDLALLALLVDSAEPVPSNMAGRCSRNFSTATDLADDLVRLRGLSFRQAHHVVGTAVRLALDAGRDACAIDTALLDKVAKDELGYPLALSEAQVRASLSAQQALQRRTTPGGAAPSAVQATIAAARGELAQAKQALASRQQSLQAAQSMLEAAIALLAG